MALILLIDDDEFYRRMLRRILEGDRHEVIEALSGPEGIEMYAAFKPAVVITDMRMPEMDGLEVIRSIRVMDRGARIIAVSGASTFYNVNFLQLAKEVGADAIVRKLDSWDRVQAAVSRLLEAV